MDVFARLHHVIVSLKSNPLGKFVVPLFLFVALLSPFSSSGIAPKNSAATSGVEKIAPLRQFYVSPNGGGPGTGSAQPMNLTTAIQTAKPGDWFWLLGGTYNGAFNVLRKGTAARPIVFRASPGAHVVINGGFQLLGAYNWIWGVEITDPRNISEFDSGVRMAARGVRLINSVIHHVGPGKNAIGAWNSGSGQVVHGNIVYTNDGHNIYMQNDFFRYGFKQIVNNMFLDADCDNCFNVHGYTLNSFVTGFNFRRNIVKNGRFLIGGYNAPAEREVVTENYFYESNVQFGYRRPTQVRFIGNYLGRSVLDIRWFWGSGEIQYKQSAPNVFMNNQIHRPSGLHIRFGTSAYLPIGRCEGCPGIRPVDVFDRNVYSNPFKASFSANNISRSPLNLTAWRNATAAAGKRFDSHSVTVRPPTTPKIAILPNQYEPRRAHLVIYNWGRRPTVTVNLSPFISVGTSYEIRQPKDLFGTPLKSGVYTGPVILNTGGQEFLAFVVFRK